MAAERLGCHWQTLLYRERRGDLTAIKIAGRKYYSLGEVEQLKRTHPVHSKPHWKKRTKTEVKETAKPTLWNRIIAYFVK